MTKRYVWANDSAHLEEHLFQSLLQRPAADIPVRLKGLDGQERDTFPLRKGGAHSLEEAQKFNEVASCKQQGMRLFEVIIEAKEIRDCLSKSASNLKE